MILSNREIQRALRQGRLVIDPVPMPFKPSISNPKTPYDATAVNLRLGPKLQIPQKAMIAIDLKGGGAAGGESIAETLRKHSQSETINLKGGYVLNPSEFVLGMTLERVQLPYPKKGQTPLAARVEGKSSIARTGLVIHLTAPTIHAGFNGPITLEIINFGKNAFVLRQEMEICQLIVEEVRGKPFEYESQFQGQDSPAGTRG